MIEQGRFEGDADERPRHPAPLGSSHKGARARPLLLLAALTVGLIIGALLMGSVNLWKLFNGRPDPVVVAHTSLQSIREQSRLTPFVARFVAVVTAKQSRLGLTAEKTLIMPGVVRYEIDLSKIQQRDVRWDQATKTLSVSLPAIELAGPEINLNELREYEGGGILMALTDARGSLDAANRARGQQDLLQQARQPLPLNLARDAARRAIERSFGMPMKAAGIEATVIAVFPEEAGSRPRSDAK